MHKNNIMLIQPGAFGDIIICAPIAKWYHDLGYNVYWPIREKFYKKMISPLSEYVIPIILDERVLDNDWLKSDVLKCLEEYNNDEKYHFMLNLADRGPHPTAERPAENFEQVKYRLSEVPFEIKHTFEWNRNTVNENLIFDRFVGKTSQYAFVHNTSSHKEYSIIPKTNLPIVMCEDFSPDYNIYDWYKVIINAEEIYVTESSIWAFCDSIVHELTDKKYLLPRSHMGDMTTISKYWKKDYYYDQLR